MRSEDAAPFGDLLREARTQAGKTMGQLARFLNVTVTYISDVERGHRAPLTIERIYDVARFLGVEPDSLLRAASRTKGTFELDAIAASSKKQELGVALMRGWPGLTDAEADEFLALLRSKK